MTLLSKLELESIKTCVQILREEVAPLMYSHLEIFITGLCMYVVLTLVWCKFTNECSLHRSGSFRMTRLSNYALIFQWEPVEYFDNKIICDLVEERHKGIIAVLDEECLRPGDVSDSTFLGKLVVAIGQHNHFTSHELMSYEDRKTIDRDQFRLVHYAGEVTYSIIGIFVCIHVCVLNVLCVRAFVLWYILVMDV